MTDPRDEDIVSCEVCEQHYDQNRETHRCPATS